MDHPWGKGSKIRPTVRPTEYRCYIKEVNPIWRSGCGYPIADGVLRLSHNSPFWQHFTQGLLLCSEDTIHHWKKKVNTFLSILLIFSEAKI